MPHQSAYSGRDSHQSVSNSDRDVYTAKKIQIVHPWNTIPSEYLTVSRKDWESLVRSDQDCKRMCQHNDLLQAQVRELLDEKKRLENELQALQIKADMLLYKSI